MPMIASGYGSDDGRRYPLVMGATEVVGTTRDERSFLLQRVQPAMTGLIDGSQQQVQG